MIRRLLALVLSGALLTGEASLAADSTELVVLGIGESVELEAGRRDEFRLSDPWVAEVRPGDPLKIRVTARREGRTRLTARGSNRPERHWRIEVTSAALQKDWSALRSSLGGVRGLSIDLRGGRLTLDGRLLTPEDRKRVTRVSQGLDVVDLTTFDRNRWEKALSASLTEKLGAPGVTARISGNRLLLVGRVDSADAARELMSRADLERPPGLESLTLVDNLRVVPRMVHVRLTFMRLGRREGGEKGINILETLKGEGILDYDGPGTPAQSLVMEARASIHNLIRKGWADILARPTITVQSGKEGRFQEGGRRIIPNGEGTPLEVNYGLIVNATPKVQSDGSVQLKIRLEVSAPADGKGLEFTRFETSTDVRCRMGQTLVLSGLATQLRRKFREATPVLGSIPLLGTFFSTEGDDEEQRDLLLLVTPEIPDIDAEVVRGLSRFRQLRARLDSDR